MLVGELRKLLDHFPDDAEVVVIGHFGEGIRMSKPYIKLNVEVGDAYYSKDRVENKIVCAFDDVDIGEEPY